MPAPPRDLPARQRASLPELRRERRRRKQDVVLRQHSVCRAKTTAGRDPQLRRCAPAFDLQGEIAVDEAESG